MLIIKLLHVNCERCALAYVISIEVIHCLCTPLCTLSKQRTNQRSQLSADSVGWHEFTAWRGLYHLSLMPELHHTGAVIISSLSVDCVSVANVLDVVVHVIQGLLSFLSAPLIGALSDIWGRKPFLLLTVTFTCVPIPLMKFSPWSVYCVCSLESIHLFTIYLHTYMYTLWLYVFLCVVSLRLCMCFYTWCFVFVCVWSRWYFALLSLSGIFSVTFSVVFAYVADVTTEEDRSAAYGLVCCCLWLGMLVVCKHWCSQFKAADIPTVQRRLLSTWFYTTAILQLRC